LSRALLTRALERYSTQRKGADLLPACTAAQILHMLRQGSLQAPLATALPTSMRQASAEPSLRVRLAWTHHMQHQLSRKQAVCLVSRKLAVFIVEEVLELLQLHLQALLLPFLLLLLVMMVMMMPPSRLLLLVQLPRKPTKAEAAQALAPRVRKEVGQAWARKGIARVRLGRRTKGLGRATLRGPL